MKYVFLSLLMIVVAHHIHAQKNPSFEEVISLKSVNSVSIAPNGAHMVITKSSVDWEENRYDRELWLSKNGSEPFQLTNNPDGNSSNAKWSPDGQWIAFTSDRGDKNQIYAIRTEGGEAFQMTHAKNGMFGFEWSPDGSQIAFLQSRDRKEEMESREDKFGGYAVEDEEFSPNEIWLIDFSPELLNQRPLPDNESDSIYNEAIQARLLIDSATFSVNDFEWSPDGKYIAIEHQPDPLRNSFFKADISIYNMRDSTVNLLVSNLSYDGLIDWSPDGNSILFVSHLNDSTSNYYLNEHFFRIDIDGNNLLELAEDFDENIYNMSWQRQGIMGIAWQRSKRPMLRIDPSTGETTVMGPGPERIGSLSFSDDGTKLAFIGSNDDDLGEVYMDHFPMVNPKKITSSTRQIEDWNVAQSEMITWKSEDGTEIEGVLHKPQDYDPNKKYPLLVIIHGGPTGISTPAPAPSYVYPMLQWLNKGALILRPNYRGSAGYGEAFRSLNVRNLGVGDAWDVLSGVRQLEDEGIIDGEKVGAMGWSQGGYISAFLTTNSDKFKAISVGAGISNWMTYYVNTDIHPFTRQYLKATPWSDKEIYEKTSPMTNINNASTPTLIQHGEFDRRVPTPNAYELFQGLQDNDVPTKLIIYKGFGHGINKPKERLVATWHNWQWFAKYIWNEEVEIPME